MTSSPGDAPRPTARARPTARRRPASGDHRAPRADPHRRLRLAARQGRPRGHGVPRGRERLDRRPGRPTSPTCASSSSTRSRRAPRRPTCRCRPATAAGGTTGAPSRDGVRRRCRVAVADPDDWTPPVPAEDCGPDEPALPGEQVLLDHDALADDHDFYSVGGVSVSPDGTLLAYSTDTVGNERYVLEVKDLATGELLPDRIEGVLGGGVWGPDGRDLYYCTVDDSWRRDKVWRHRLGTAQADDELVHHETDGRFWVGVGRSRTDRFLVAVSGSKNTSESRFLDTHDPDAGWVVFHPREEGLEYGLEHAVIGGEDVFLVLHNHTGADFEIGTAPIAATPPDGLAAARPARRGGAARGRVGVRRAPRRAPAQRRSDPAPDPRARRRRGRRRLPRRVPPGALHRRRLGRRRGRPAHRARRLHLDDRAVVGLRLRRPHPRAHPAQAAARARPRPRGVRGAPALGHRRRRRAGADLAGLPQGGRRRRADPLPALRLRRLRDLHRPRASRWPGSPCSTAAPAWRSRTCAAAARWAATGTTTASSSTSSTPSPTSPPAPGTSSTRAGRPTTGWSPRAARPAAC